MKKLVHKMFFSRGVLLDKHWLVWAYTEKGHMAWAPHWVLGLVVHLWNFVSCRTLGHYYFLDQCVHCGKRG